MLKSCFQSSWFPFLYSVVAFADGSGGLFGKISFSSSIHRRVFLPFSSNIKIACPVIRCTIVVFFIYSSEFIVNDSRRRCSIFHLPSWVKVPSCLRNDDVFQFQMECSSNSIGILQTKTTWESSSLVMKIFLYFHKWRKLHAQWWSTETWQKKRNHKKLYRSNGVCCICIIDKYCFAICCRIRAAIAISIIISEHFFHFHIPFSFLLFFATITTATTQNRDLVLHSTHNM